jgi:quercetin dioxygenase-like cupin family protein
MRYKVIKSGEFVSAPNPNPGQRARVEILNATEAQKLNGILGIIPASSSPKKPAYHYHNARESVIQILSGSGTEMIEGEGVPLRAGDVIFIPPGVKHTLMNNSATEDLKYMEFYTPVGPDVVRVQE